MGTKAYIPLLLDQAHIGNRPKRGFVGCWLPAFGL